MFCVTSVLGISWQALNHLRLLAPSVYRNHVYFHVQITLDHLSISLPQKDRFSEVKNSYITCILRHL